MQSNKPEGRAFRRRCESAFTPCRKAPGIPVLSSKKSRILNKIPKDIPTPSVGIKRVRKVHNCLAPELFSVSETPKSTLKRKSISLVELSTTTKIQTPRKWQSREHGDQINFTNTPRNNGKIPNFTSSREFELALKVCKRLYLHAWRRKRNHVMELQSRNQKLANENGNLQVQTNVLRNLLDSEQLRVTVATSDSAHLKQRLEMELKASNEISERLDRLEAEKTEWEVTRSQMAAEIQFLSESLSLENIKLQEVNDKVKMQQQELDISNKKELELLEKLEKVEDQLDYRINLMNEMDIKNAERETTMADLNSTINILTTENESKTKEIHECYEKIKSKGKELSSLRRLLKDQKENVKNLEKEIAMKLDEIETKDSAIMSLKSVIAQEELEQERSERNLIRMRNKVVFEAIKISASLFWPKPASMAI